MYETNVIDLKHGWYILCYSYRWQNEKKIHSVALTDFPKQYHKNPEDNSALCKALWTLFDEANVIVSHNIKFDIKKSNARFIKHGLPPPSPYKTYCTLTQSRRLFAFSSNRLNDLGRYFGFGRKLQHTGWDLWRRAMHGDGKAWVIMRRYCSRDVELLVKVYERIRSWSSTHPRLTLPSETTHCPTCRSHHTIKRGLKHYKTRSVQQRKCLDCESWFLAEAA